LSQYARALAVVVGSFAIMGCEQGNDTAINPGGNVGNAPTSPEDAMKIGKNAPDPTKKVKPMAPAPGPDAK
jgi:hypothetical protein